MVQKDKEGLCCSSRRLIGHQGVRAPLDHPLVVLRELVDLGDTTDLGLSAGERRNPLWACGTRADFPRSETQAAGAGVARADGQALTGGTDGPGDPRGVWRPWPAGCQCRRSSEGPVPKSA